MIRRYDARLPSAGRVTLLAVAALVWACASPEGPEAPAPEAQTAVLEAVPWPVRVGLERLAEGPGDILVGKRIGLVAHAASVTFDGRHAIDVLRELDLDLVRLFTPEHGLRGRAAAGEQVESGIDPASGLPVVSLYGKKRKPAPEDLAGLDVLVFDLQGAGVRFYTYVSTLVLCLEAAAEARLEFVVLDRPNPLGGERIEGPISAAREIVAESFINMAPGPLVHGLTLGEMARYVNSLRSAPARLVVVPMAGWQRRMVWGDTGRPWIAPSPNLRSAEAALVYPGTAILEATNISEGRGTSDPFLMIGAPWLDPAKVRVSVPGFALESITFTPQVSAAAPKPKFAGEVCKGFRVRVTDPVGAEPYRLGVNLVTELMKQPAFEWRRSGEALTGLLGTDRPLTDLLAGKSVEEILSADAADHETWRRSRQVCLLY